MAFLVVVFIVILIVAIAVSHSDGKEKKALESARLKYQDGLQLLKADPTNPHLREKVLGLGREYSNLTRNKKGVTIFDEVALSNDIGAACAAAGRVQEPTATVETGSSAEERLRRLEALRSSSLISDDEYQANRDRILSEI